MLPDYARKVYVYRATCSLEVADDAAMAAASGCARTLVASVGHVLAINRVLLPEMISF